MVIYLIEILKKWVKIVLMTAKWESKKKKQAKVVKMTATSESKKKKKKNKTYLKFFSSGNRNSIDHLFTQSSCNYIFMLSFIYYHRF